VTPTPSLIVSACFDEVSSWMRANRLQVNPCIGVLLVDDSIRSRPRQYVSAVLMCCRYSQFAISGYISTPTSVCEHMSPPPSDRALHSVRRCLPQHALLTLIRALVVSKVDYCCSVYGVLAGVSGHLLDRLQSILNVAAARLVFSARRSERITPLLRDLHWLRVPERIQFRLCVLAYSCLNGPAPLYLAESIRRTADVEGRRHLRSSMLVVPSVQRLTLGDRAFPVAA